VLWSVHVTAAAVIVCVRSIEWHTGATRELTRESARIIGTSREALDLLVHELTTEMADNIAAVKWRGWR
jgi:hypothetical protein